MESGHEISSSAIPEVVLSSGDVNDDENVDECANQDLDLDNQENASDSLPTFLSFEEKNSKFKWAGSFDELKEFTETSIGLIDKPWTFTINGERSQTIKSKTASLILYKTGTLQIQGADAKVKSIKDKLTSLLGTQSSGNGAEPSANATFRNVLNPSDLQMNGTQHESTNYASESYCRNEVTKIWKLINEDILPTISKVKLDAETIRNSNLLKNDWDEVQQANESLRNEVKSLKNHISQQNRLIENLEIEKSSLLTSLRLLNSEKNSHSEVLGNTKRIASNHSTTTEISELSTASSSKYSNSTSLLRPKSRKPNTPQQFKNQNKSSASANPRKKFVNPNEAVPTVKASNRRSSIIIGDSMISKLEGWRMSNKSHQVSVRSFPGATVEDMSHYIVPSIQKSPDKIIVHVGTNNLMTDNPTVVAEKIVDLCTEVENNLPNCSVAISELISRDDDDSLNHKVSQVNKVLRTFCKSRDWILISHNDITKDHLNSKGLHLNKNGISQLAKTFNNHVRAE